MKNISRRDREKSEMATFLPLPDETLESLSFNARITVQTTLSDMTISAKIYYSGMDSINIQIKDPLKRKLATVWLIDNSYYLWLQRENRELSGSEFPENINDFQIPDIPISSISHLLIGQIDSKNTNYKIKRDQFGRLQQVFPKSDQNVTIQYNHWVTIDSSYQIPDDIRITNNQNTTIDIHSSQFRLKIRKLS